MFPAIKLRFFSALVLLFVLSSILMLPGFASSNKEVAVSSILEAEQSVAQAYETFLSAEKAGADVSVLVVELNNASGLLSEARVSFEAGDFEGAIRFAGLSSGIGRDVASEAKRLKVEADSANASRSWWFLVGSVMGLFVVVSASFVGYGYFKRFYYRRLLKMRPKVG